MVERVKSGIPGFDELVQERIPKRNIVLLSGGPGTADLLARPRELYAPLGRFIGSPHLFEATSVI
jgi:hypothetical protein